MNEAADEKQRHSVWRLASVLIGNPRGSQAIYHPAELQVLGL